MSRSLDEAQAHRPARAFATIIKMNATMKAKRMRRNRSGMGPLARQRPSVMIPQTIDEQPSASAILAIAPQAAIDESLGPWLYSVAGRVAARARANRRKRRARERSNRELPEPSYSSTADAAEIPRVIHDELGRLPERLRAPLVLC